MSDAQLIIEDIPQLSGKTAIELLDFLYCLTTAIENQYFARIRLYSEQEAKDQNDRLESRPDAVDFDDPLPDF